MVDDKQKSLDAALGTIKKQFGEGAIMKMGDFTERMQIEVIPTGSIALDIALGVGGLPRGRIIEIYGPESAGKCLTADTMIAGPLGLLSIAEIFEMQGVVASCTSRTTAAKIALQNKYGVVEETTHITHNNSRPTLTITTASGAKIRSTANHPHLMMSERGNLVWNETQNLKVGDYLSLARKTMSGPNERDVNEMYLLGLLAADGNVYDKRVMVTNDDPNVKSFLESGICSELIGTEPRIHRNDRGGSITSNQYHFNTKKGATALIERTGIVAGETAGTKTVPMYVRTADRTAVKAYIQGYMDSESSCDKSGIEVTSKSYELLATIKILLTQFGIHSRIAEKKASNYPENMYYRMQITGDNARRYAIEIGSRSEKVQRRLENIEIGTYGSTNHDSIPHQGGYLRDLSDGSPSTNRDSNRLICDYMGESARAKLTYERLSLILNSQAFQDGAIKAHFRELVENNYVYDEIVSITNNEPEPTFDFAMSQTASFVANGIVTHNTSLALHVIAEAQKQGGNAAFVDVEHALDPVYARNLGIDLDRLYVSQPDAGEQALDIAESLVRSNAVDVIVIDSVAALVTKSELEGDMGDSNIGQQARLMSQACRKLTAAISHSKCIVIFINQLRDKIGVMFGSPETTSGGRALKFYASVRLDIRKLEQIKIGNDVVGSRTRVKVVKNKVAPPFRQAEFDISFGRGISRTGSLVDIGLEQGFVSKSGSWYNYGDARIGQGRENAKSYLSEHPEIADVIESQIREKLLSAKPSVQGTQVNLVVGQRPQPIITDNPDDPWET